jgi:ABC-type transport system involved in multi-copper enzyme maturation permease subunit
MLTIYLESLRETLHRRLGLAMLVIASLAAVLQIPLSLVTEAGKTYAISGRSHIPVAEYVAMRFESTAMVTNNIWTLVALFAVAPLLASHLEKGWAELLFAKGVTRWQIVTARLGAALTTWAVLLSVMAIFPNLLLAWRTGTPVMAFLGAGDLQLRGVSLGDVPGVVRICERGAAGGDRLHPGGAVDGTDAA